MSNDQKIPFIVELRTGKGATGQVAAVDLPIDKLRENVKNATTMLAEVFQDVGRIGAFELKELTLGLEVGAEGGVHFIGTCKVSGSGSVTLKFAPPTVNQPPA